MGPGMTLTSDMSVFEAQYTGHQKVGFYNKIKLWIELDLTLYHNFPFSDSQSMILFPQEECIYIL